MFPHESLDGEGKSCRVEQNLPAAINHHYFKVITICIEFVGWFIFFSNEHSNLGGKWEITLSNIPLKSCKNQIVEICRKAIILNIIIMAVLVFPVQQEQTSQINHKWRQWVVQSNPYSDLWEQLIGLIQHQHLALAHICNLEKSLA